MKIRPTLPMILCVLAISLPAAQSQCLSVTRTLMLDRHSTPKRLLVNHPKGEVRISAGDSRSLVVQARLRIPASGDNESSIGLKISRHNGSVMIHTRSGERIIDLDIQMPETWALRLDHGERGDVYVHGIRGEAEIQSRLGDVHMESMSGPVLGHTVEGDLNAGFAVVPEDAAMVLISVSGRVTVSLPADSHARVRLRSRNGKVQSDFPMGETASGWKEARIGTGGPLIRLESLENLVILRRSNPRE